MAILQLPASPGKPSPRQAIAAIRQFRDRHALKGLSVFAPSIWPLEVANVLLVAERKKRLSEADTVRFITLLSELSIIVEPENTDRMIHEIVALARKYHLSSYDASYLHLAMPKRHSPCNS